ncbi:hypothetical protein NDU88_001561 [Pleurodeles waltl]|uniref:Uncharacterized protein n=1 Tax=Pleurodeles waltl TaxID=8319 RepID=A0AAV7LBT2_PLEWA|nr:hypothetical protein NDU88_001561 [Pleurodeles waltl]
MREGLTVATVLSFWVCRRYGIGSGGAAGKTSTSWRTDSRCVFTEQFGGMSSCPGLAEVFGWFTMAPKMAKISKVPRVSRGKPDRTTGVEVRDQKQPPVSQMTRISKHRMRGQSGLLMKKEPSQVRGSLQDVGSKDEAVKDVEPQISEMLKQLLRTRCLTSQLPGNEGTQDARILAHDRIIQDRIMSTAGTSRNQEGTGTTLLLDDLVDLRISNSEPLQVSQPDNIPQVVVAEGAALGVGKLGKLDQVI